MQHYCMGRLLLESFVMLMLVDMAFAERLTTEKMQGLWVPLEFDDTVPSQVVLVSEMLVSPCSGYPFRIQGISENYCFDHALETAACAVDAAGGVELWVMTREATTQDAFLQYFDNKYPSRCLSALNSSGLLVFITNELGASKTWVRDYAPTLSIEDGQPKRLLMLPYKKKHFSGHSELTNDEQLVSELSLAIADQIGCIINDCTLNLPLALEPPVIYSFPKGIGNCVFDWGNFETDGAGVCLSTYWSKSFRDCWKNEATNLRAFLQENAGCEYFPDDLVPFPEQTRHVDIFARVIGPSKLLMTSYKSEQETKLEGASNSQVLFYAAKIAKSNSEDFVEAFKEETGVEIQVHKLPTPTSAYKSRVGRKEDVLIGYANVLMIKGKDKKVLLFPTFGDRFQNLKANDNEARTTWMKMLGIKNSQDVFDIAADRMMEAGGGPHCMTKQYQFRAGADSSD